MVVPTTPYRHDEHGRVVVKTVTDGVVYFDVIDETIRGAGQPLPGRQPRPAFEAVTEPAAQGVSLPDAALDADQLHP